jgi:hypothetical protein
VEKAHEDHPEAFVAHTLPFLTRVMAASQPEQPTIANN